MKSARQRRLEKRGWRFGSADEFLNLTPEETALINMRLSLSDALRTRRARLGISQSELARRLGSSQSRVAKMEAAEADVSIDLLVRAIFALGGTPAELGRIIAAA